MRTKKRYAKHNNIRIKKKTNNKAKRCFECYKEGKEKKREPECGSFYIRISSHL